MLANPSGAPSASFRILNDGNLGFTKRWIRLKRAQIKLPPWAVSTLDLEFVGLSMDGTDEISIPPKMALGPLGVTRCDGAMTALLGNPERPFSAGARRLADVRYLTPVWSAARTFVA